MVAAEEWRVDRREHPRVDHVRIEYRGRYRRAGLAGTSLSLPSNPAARCPFAWWILPRLIGHPFVPDPFQGLQEQSAGVLSVEHDFHHSRLIRLLGFFEVGPEWSVGGDNLLDGSGAGGAALLSLPSIPPPRTPGACWAR